jgi:archaellum biogenesis ATPase FlaH
MTCAACGGPLRHLDPGRRYLIVTSNPGIAFAWMRDLSKNEKPSVCMTTASPDRIRLEYDVKNMSIVQVSARARGALDPKKLDPAGLKAILPLAREGKGGAILYDSLDQMVSESSLGDMIRFLRKANDMAFVHGATVIARVSPGQLADQELSRLNAEFDEYIDLSGQL